jgi:hypothetical protein
MNETLKKILKALGKDEILWATYRKEGEEDPIYCITSPKSRQHYILYAVRSDGLERIAKGSSPVDLEKKYMKL